MVPNYLGAWRKHREISQDDAAAAIGTTKSMYGKLERGERTLDVDWLEKIGRAFKCEPYQLIAAPPDDTTSATEAAPITLDDVAAEHGFIFVEEVDLAIGMGAGFLTEHPEVVGIAPFREDWVRGLFDGPLEHLKVVRPKGDSMQPTILDGDIVLVDTSHRMIDDQDRIWAIAYGDLGVIRRVRVTPRGSWMLMPDNQVLRPEEVSDGEAHVIGRVIWIGRRI